MGTAFESLTEGDGICIKGVGVRDAGDYRDLGIQARLLSLA